MKQDVRLKMRTPAERDLRGQKEPSCQRIMGSSMGQRWGMGLHMIDVHHQLLLADLGVRLVAVLPVADALVGPLYATTAVLLMLADWVIWMI